MKTPFKLILALLVLAGLPGRLLACAACGSANANAGHSDLIDGMNLGIMTLLGVVVCVLGTFLAFLIYLIRKSEAMNAGAEPLPKPTDI